MSSKGAAEVGNTRIEFLLEGAGDVVVLIPGGGLDTSYFEDLARRIAGAGFRSVAVNPRGVGASKGQLEGLTLHDLAGDVAAVIDALGSGPAHVLGHGFSNRVARCLASDRPDLVRSVILLAGVGLFVPEAEVVKALQAWFSQDTTEADCLEATKRLVADPAAAERILRQVKRWPVVAAAQRAADRATPQNDWIEPPGQVSFLVVQGLKDRVAPPEHGRAFRERLGPASRWRTFPMLVIWSSSSSPSPSPKRSSRFFASKRRDPADLHRGVEVDEGLQDTKLGRWSSLPDGR